MTIKQIHELLQIIRNQHNLTIVRNLGVEYLLPQEIELLFKSGIDVNKIKTKDLVKNMFYMGLISDVLGRQSKSLTFAELKKHISNPREILPFTQRENIVIDSIKNQFLGDIRANEGRIFRDVNNIITQGQQNNRQSYEQVIRDEVLRGVIDKKATSQIASDLGHKTGDWSRDFSRIIGFISHKAFDEGRASLYERKGGKDIEVYKDVFEGACFKCINLYTTNGIGSKPKIFKLSELQGNGTNIGRKSAEWLAVVGSTHLNCRCTLNEVPQGFEWNEKTKAFDIPIERKEEDKPNRQPIRMTFNGKEYSV